MNSNKLALFVPSLRGGGAERVMVNLARAFNDMGISVDLVLAQAEGPYLKEVPNNVKIVDLSAKRVLTSLPALVRYLKHTHPRAMLSAMGHANIVAVWATRLARVETRLVMSEHNTISRTNSVATMRARLMPMLARKFYPWANSVVMVSQAVKEDFLRMTQLDPDGVKVIYNPVITPGLYQKAKLPVEHPWLSDKKSPVILGAGRLTKQKDFFTLIRAFALVRQQIEAKLILIGEGEDRPALENLISELDIAEDVDLHGFVDNPYAYMAKADVFALTSAWEGLPTVLIESLAVGMQVVSTDCPSGPREILNNGEYGALVPVGDVAAVARSILQVIREGSNDKISLQALESYNLDNVVKTYHSVLFGESFA